MRGDVQGQTLWGGQDAFLRKYDGNGAELWNRLFGSTLADVARSVAVDGAGNVYVAGYAFDPNPPSGSAGTTDAFLSKYVNGTEKWALGSGSIGSELSQGVAATAGGSIYVAGYSPTDALLKKYDASGTSVWTRSIKPLSGTAVGLAVAVSASGTVCIAGSTPSAFPGLVSAGRKDAFVQVLPQ